MFALCPASLPAQAQQSADVSQNSTYSQQQIYGSQQQTPAAPVDTSSAAYQANLQAITASLGHINPYGTEADAVAAAIVVSSGGADAGSADSTGMTTTETPAQVAATPVPVMVSAEAPAAANVATADPASTAGMSQAQIYGIPPTAAPAAAKSAADQANDQAAVAALGDFVPTGMTPVVPAGVSNASAADDTAIPAAAPPVIPAAVSTNDSGSGDGGGYADPGRAGRVGSQCGRR